MSNAETITSRIHRRSDDALEKAVDKAVNAFKQSLSDLKIQSYHVRVPIHRGYVTTLDGASVGTDNLPEHVAIRLDFMLERFKAALIECAKDGARTRAVDEYIARIDQLSEEVESLQAEVQNINQS